MQMQRGGRQSTQCNQVQSPPLDRSRRTKAFFRRLAALLPQDWGVPHQWSVLTSWNLSAVELHIDFGTTVRGIERGCFGPIAGSLKTLRSYSSYLGER